LINKFSFLSKVEKDEYMQNNKIPKIFNWLLRHTITVFSCVLIIVLGTVFLVHATGTTTIGEDISTTNLTTSGNATVGGTLGITGASTFSSSVTITNASTTALTITQSGAGSIVDFVGDSITTGTGIPISIDGLTSGTGLNITSTSTAGAESGISKLFNISRSGTNANASHTAYGFYSSVANTGTTSTNVAGYLSASGATNNYGLIVENGKVGIGTASPDSVLDVVGNADIANGSLWQPVYGSNDGLVIYLPFKENTGTTTYDHSPKGNDGTITDGEGDQWSTGKYGYAVDLGNGDYISAGVNGLNKSQGTAELWVKPNWDGDDNTDHHFFDGGSGTFKNRLTLYKYTDNKLWFWYAGPTDWSGTMLSYDISSWNNGEWHHLAATWSSSSAKLYVDGQLVNSSNPGTEPASLGSTFYVGIDKFLTAANSGDAVIDELRVYSRVLDQDEIRTHYLREEQGSVITADQFRVVNTSATTRLIIDTSGKVGIGTTDPQSELQVNGYIQMNANDGAPAAGDCDADAERGRMILDYTNNRLYICNGATRGWDYMGLTN